MSTMNAQARERTKPTTNNWRMRFLRRDGTWEGALVAVWEAAWDPISDNYTPDEISAEDLLRKWAESVTEKYRDGLIPIHWFVECREAGKFTYFPFAYAHGLELAGDKFLEMYSWPEHAVTGEPLNWLTLPVVDKLWKTGRADKGGFIQQATGWKPGIVQPFLYLPTLLRSRE